MAQADSPDPAADSGISDAAFAAAMGEFGLQSGDALAVAVSGGADSMALLLLLQAWAQPRHITLTALTVDHCLRDAAAVEARQVAAWAGALGVAHVVLEWDQGRAQRGLTRSAQTAARAARYDLMTGWCRAQGVKILCLAHHADDQVETFLMRLTRGSGVDGLAAMASVSLRDGITLARPLLAFAKTALLATCRARGQAWIEDPSNANAKATRVRFRQSRELLEREGLSTDRLLATVGHLQRARAALSQMVEALLARACRWDAYGVARLALGPLAEAPQEIGLRALAQILIIASGADYGPRFDGLERLYRALTCGPWRDATLHGCAVLREGDAIMIFREAAAIDEASIALSPNGVLWDGRFHISGPAALLSESVTVRPLTAAVWRMLVDQGLAPALPPAIRAALPMLVDQKGPAVVPWAVFVRGDLMPILQDHAVICRFAPRRSVAEMAPFAEM